MLEILKTVTMSPEQYEIVIEGMRNPKNSWNRMDSGWHAGVDCNLEHYEIGLNDLNLMESLAKNGPVHAKYRRMMPVYVTINAPLYWWKEYDTYKVGTVCNSCSTMHKISSRDLTIDDFSHEHLLDDPIEAGDIPVAKLLRTVLDRLSSKTVLWFTVWILNRYRAQFLKTNDKKYWWQIIQLLPSSYNQKRTIMLNYEVLHNIYESRRFHKLDEWHTFCDWIETLPYSELITVDLYLQDKE